MPNIDAFWPVVHEKIYQNFPYFAPYWATKGSPYLNKSESPLPK